MQSHDRFMLRKEQFKEKASELIKSKQYRKAIEIFDLIIQKSPKPDPTIYDLRGGVRFLLHQYAEAIDDFNKAIECDRFFSSSFHNRGATKMFFGQYQEAIEDFTQVMFLEKEPDIKDVNALKRLSAQRYSAAVRCRGLAKLELGRYEEAIVDFNKSIACREFKSYRSRGLAQYMLGNIKEAAQDYVYAGAYPNDKSHNFFSLGVMYWLQGNIDRATYNLKIAAKESLLSQIILARYSEDHDLQKAKNLTEKLEKEINTPTHKYEFKNGHSVQYISLTDYAYSFLMYGQIAEQQQDIKTAKEAYKKSLSFKELYAARQALSVIEAQEFLDGKQYDRVLKLVDMLIKQNPNCLKAYLLRAKANEALKQFTVAAADYRFILSKGANNDVADILKRLEEKEIPHELRVLAGKAAIKLAINGFSLNNEEKLLPLHSQKIEMDENQKNLLATVTAECLREKNIFIDQLTQEQHDCLIKHLAIRLKNFEVLIVTQKNYVFYQTPLYVAINPDIKNIIDNPHLKILLNTGIDDWMNAKALDVNLSPYKTKPSAPMMSRSNSFADLTRFLQDSIPSAPPISQPSSTITTPVISRRNSIEDFSQLFQPSAPPMSVPPSGRNSPEQNEIENLREKLESALIANQANIVPSAPPLSRSLSTYGTPSLSRRNSGDFTKLFSASVTPTKLTSSTEDEKSDIESMERYYDLQL